MSALLAAAERLTRRLRILQKLQAQYRDMGMATVELDVAELFEPGDQAAIEAFEAAVAKVTGQTPLPWELSA